MPTDFVNIQIPNTALIYIHIFPEGGGSTLHQKYNGINILGSKEHLGSKEKHGAFCEMRGLLQFIGNLCTMEKEHGYLLYVKYATIWLKSSWIIGRQKTSHRFPQRLCTIPHGYGVPAFHGNVPKFGTRQNLLNQLRRLHLTWDSNNSGIPEK